MDESKFKKGLSKNEFCGLLDKIHELNQTISIWQNIDDIKRNVLDVEIISLNFEKSILIVRPKSTDENFDLDSEKPLYFHAKTRDLTFKSELYQQKGNALLIFLPSNHETIFSELRNAQRFNMEEADNREIGMEVEVGLSGSGKFKYYRYRIIDISETGIGIEIKSHQMGKLQIGGLAVIKNLSDINVSMLESEVVHITKFDQEKNVYKAGLQFKKNLQRDIIKQLIE